VRPHEHPVFLEGPLKAFSSKREAPSLHAVTSHWLHENSIPNIGCNYLWPGLIALPKSTLPILRQNTFTPHKIKNKCNYTLCIIK